MDGAYFAAGLVAMEKLFWGGEGTRMEMGVRI
jgi:hypothetical protein